MSVSPYLEPPPRTLAAVQQTKKQNETRSAPKNPKRSLADYDRSATADSFLYRLRGTARTFAVCPFCGLWRATNGTRYAIAATAEVAATKFVEGL